MSVHACLCACDGDEVKSFFFLPSTLVYACILLGTPACKGRGFPFILLLAFQCIPYTPRDPVKLEENRPSGTSE